MAKGLWVRVSRSKTDQDGAGEVIAVPNGKRLRPVALVNAWQASAGITDGFVFQHFVSRADHLSDLPMDDASMALVVSAAPARPG